MCEFNKNHSEIGMEIDCFAIIKYDGKEYKIGIEHDGIQHRVETPHYHRTPTAFKEQQERDAQKDKLCIDKNVDLTRIQDRGIITTPNLRSHCQKVLIDVAVRLGIPYNTTFY